MVPSAPETPGLVLCEGIRKEGVKKLTSWWETCLSNINKNLVRKQRDVTETIVVPKVFVPVFVDRTRSSDDRSDSHRLDPPTYTLLTCPLSFSSLLSSLSGPSRGVTGHHLKGV